MIPRPPLQLPGGLGKAEGGGGRGRRTCSENPEVLEPDGDALDGLTRDSQRGPRSAPRALRAPTNAPSGSP